MWGSSVSKPKDRQTHTNGWIKTNTKIRIFTFSLGEKMVLPFHTVWKFSLRFFCFHKITFTRCSHCAHLFHIFTFSHCYAASKWDISKTYQFLNKGNSVKMWKCENVKYFIFFTAKNIRDPVWNMFEKFSHFHSLPSRHMSWSAKSRIAGISHCVRFERLKAEGSPDTY